MTNMIFQHTWEQVVAGAKTQTRRIVRKGDYSYPDTGRILEARFNGRPFYACAQTFAVMPARAVKGLRKIADIQITRIRREDVRKISEADAVAEGFIDALDFWHTWVEMHDKAFYETFKYAADMGYLREYGFFERPDKYYQAWALDFRVVNVYDGAVAKARELLQEAA